LWCFWLEPFNYGMDKWQQLLSIYLIINRRNVERTLSLQARKQTNIFETIYVSWDQMEFTAEFDILIISWLTMYVCFIFEELQWSLGYFLANMIAWCCRSIFKIYFHFYFFLVKILFLYLCIFSLQKHFFIINSVVFSIKTNIIV